MSVNAHRCVVVVVFAQLFARRLVESKRRLVSAGDVVCFAYTRYT